VHYCDLTEIEIAIEIEKAWDLDPDFDLDKTVACDRPVHASFQACFGNLTSSHWVLYIIDNSKNGEI